MSIESTALGAIITKYGWLKLFTLLGAVAGAAMMAAFNPPKTRKELFLQASVALGASFLFGDTAVRFADWFFNFIDLTTAPYWDFLQFYVTVHGLLGALSWGLFGGIAAYRDRFISNPTEAIKNAKDAIR